MEEGSTVTVVISKGKQTVTLPDLAGYTEAEAIEQIKNLNLNAKRIQEYSDTVPAGKVIRQSPSPYEELMPGSTVQIVVSLGPTPPSSEAPVPSSSEAPEPPGESEPGPDPNENP